MQRDMKGTNIAHHASHRLVACVSGPVYQSSHMGLSCLELVLYYVLHSKHALKFMILLQPSLSNSWGSAGLLEGPMLLRRASGKWASKDVCR
eukprot:3359942-Amphidinium_carterae.2